jgi:hypothetical protein
MYCQGKIMSTVMKKTFFLLFVITSALYTHTISCCPFQFCPEDQRPFFEQYEETNPILLTPFSTALQTGDPNKGKTILKIKKEEQ